ncbi:hypothetical protein [Parabacteroides distasonis]|uniref:hypothetical protein n=1 Tax=Parabacteroides distasonis TaxID=823 RepID=UPI001E2CE758|nr:hypothetical protein [Parabacteroides distasonis]MDB9051668.1 hypothetical protein [Parabacteroides distasonis]MDB9060338.1 hypothetical protein [Parabacteroides distasonis]MDB9088891.1 hypothetical protein [Parabacteroides distasonis]
MRLRQEICLVGFLCLLLNYMQLYAIASAGKAEKIMSAGFIRKYSLVSSSAVQAAARKLMELDLLTEEDNIYFIPDILFRMYLQRLKNTNIIFIPS